MILCVGPINDCAALMLDPQQQITFTISIESTAFSRDDKIDTEVVHAALRHLLDQLNMGPTMERQQNLDQSFYLNLFWQAVGDSRGASRLPYHLFMHSVVRQLEIERWNEVLTHSRNNSVRFWISHKPDGILTIGAVLQASPSRDEQSRMLLLISKIQIRVFTGSNWITGLRALYESGLIEVLMDPANIEFIFNAEYIFPNERKINANISPTYNSSLKKYCTTGCVRVG